MSSFEYAYRHGDIAAAMGADFDDDGPLLPRRKRAERIGADLTALQRRAVAFLMAEFPRESAQYPLAELKKGSPEHDRLVAALAGDNTAPAGARGPAGRRPYRRRAG